MARIQQKSAGRRIKRERLDAQNMRTALKTALEKSGEPPAPFRFGHMSSMPGQRKKPPIS
jgi:hypothetical protein